MSKVVLRCSNCGTTQANLGECEACHEAQVAYYCTNHSPGRWLKSPTCSQCGARFGEASPAGRTSPPAPRPPPAMPMRQPVPEPLSPRTRRTPSRELSEPASTPTALPLPAPIREDPGGAEREVMSRRLRDILMRGPAVSRYPEVRPSETSDASPPRNAVSGLVRRLMMLAFFFLAAMFLLSLFAGGPLLQILLNILINS